MVPVIWREPHLLFEAIKIINDAISGQGSTYLIPSF